MVKQPRAAKAAERTLARLLPRPLAEEGQHAGAKDEGKAEAEEEEKEEEADEEEEELRQLLHLRGLRASAREPRPAPPWRAVL